MSKDRGLDPSKGGRARAEKLSKAKRSEIARAAAEARWGVSAARAAYGSPDSPLRIGDAEITCYVLEDGRRVLSQRGLQGGIGFSRSAAKGGARRLAHFLLSLEKKGLDLRGLSARAAEPLEFVPPHGGPKALGYEATILPDICNAVLEARRAGLLLKQQENIAVQCEILLAGLSQIGIIALVDEATGYQDARSRDALAKILEEFIAKELQKWVKTFPPEFYKEMFRLREIPYDAKRVKRPSYIGHLTNSLIYDRLAPGVRKALKDLTPRDSKGRHKQKLHQRLSEDIGHPKLLEHLSAVIAIMQGYDGGDWDGFIRHLDRAKPKWDDTLQLPFPKEKSVERASH